MRCACLLCGYVYKSETGDPERGIVPGTEACDLPAEWRCPRCQAEQDSFAMMEDDD